VYVLSWVRLEGFASLNLDPLKVGGILCKYRSLSKVDHGSDRLLDPIIGSVPLTNDL
jgi:hypothetical protein